MKNTAGSRHLTASEVSELAVWIVSADSVPSWAEVADIAYEKFGVRRTAEAIRRRKELKSALDARRSVPVLRSSERKLTKRQSESIEAENIRLRAEVERLEIELTALLERNFRLVNAMSLRQIPEHLMERPLPLINRDPTYLKK